MEGELLLEPGFHDDLVKPTTKKTPFLFLQYRLVTRIKYRSKSVGGQSSRQKFKAPVRDFVRERQRHLHHLFCNFLMDL